MRHSSPRSTARMAVGSLVVAAIAPLSACSSSGDGPMSAECVPRVVMVSQAVARPGDPVVVEAQAAGCLVRFTDDGRLTLVLRALSPDGDGKVVELARVTAAPSGAYRTTAVIPRDVSSGGWSVQVGTGLPEPSCNDTGGGLASCAFPEAYLRIVDRSVDYTTGRARVAAEQVARRIEHDLHGGAGFLSAEVLPGGVQVSVAHPFRDRNDRVIAAAQQDAVGLMAKVPGAPEDDLVPVTRSNGFSNIQELRRLQARVLQDRVALGRKGVVLDAVTLDPPSGSVVATVHDYTDRSARVLARRYPEGLRALPAS